MLLKDNKGNLFELDEMLSGFNPQVKDVEKEDCQSCPYQGMCEDEQYSENDSRLLFFEISTN